MRNTSGASMKAFPACYKAARWDEAIACFEGVLEIRPGDPPAKLIYSALPGLEGTSPGREWDGVFTMTRK